MVKIEENEIRFINKLTVGEYIDICNRWAKPLPTADHKWWLRQTSFGYFFLAHVVCSVDDLEIFNEIKDDLTWRDWHMFIPVLKNFFITNTEFRQIIGNISFVKGRPSVGTQEDPVFNIYMMYRQLNGFTNFDELLNMNYKTFFKLYLYTMGDAIMEKVNKGVPPPGMTQ